MNSSAVTPVQFLKLSYRIKPKSGGADLFGWVDCLSLEDGLDIIEIRHRIALDEQESWSITNRGTQRVIASSAKLKTPPLILEHKPSPKPNEPVLVTKIEEQKEEIGRVIICGRAIIQGATWNV